MNRTEHDRKVRELNAQLRKVVAEQAARIKQLEQLNRNANLLLGEAADEAMRLQATIDQQAQRRVAEVLRRSEAAKRKKSGRR